MPFLNIDDKFAFHPKTVAAENEAVGALVRMAAWSRDHGTDGAVPSNVAMLIAVRAEVLERLLSVFFLEKSGDTYVVHDFLEWNVSARVARQRSKQKRLAGLRGAEKRWQSDSRRHGSAMAEPMGEAWQNDGSRARDPHPHPHPQDLASGAAPPAAKPKRPKKVARHLPADWDPSGWAYTWARTTEDVRLDEELVDRELSKFRDHHTAKGSTFADWDAALRTWLRNARKFAPHAPEPGPPRRTPPPAPPPRREILENAIPDGVTLDDLFARTGRSEG